MESLVGQTLDSYKILEIIGRGGMGVVFRALDTNLDKIVALKMIDPVLARDESFVRRFKTEARALAKLDSPNIVGVYALRETEPYFFMVMEYVDAKPLSQWIRENGKLKLTDILKISTQLLNAISFAHQSAIIHRDIKPSNILLCNNGVIKVTDFGLAKLIKSQDTGATVTQAQAGTLYYMSPEQVKGLKNVDRRGDIYSIGMTIYEMTVGRVPFDKTDSDFTIQRKIVDGEIPSPVTFCKDVPKKLIKIIQKSIARDPDKRYQTAEEMLEDIRKFEKDLQDEDKTVVISGLKEKKKKFFNLKTAIIIPAFIILAGIVLVYILSMGTDTDVTQKAFMSLSSHPPDAIIKVNGEVIERSNLDKIVFDKEGDVKINITSPGFEPIDTLIRAESGKAQSLVFYLNPISKADYRGRLTLRTNPADAKILINSEPVGESPLNNIATISGEVNLNIEKIGYQPIDTLINIIEEKENTFTFTLNKITEFGGLNITSDPSNAEVWLDWKKTGTTPFDEGELPAGTHQLIIRKNGFADHKQSVKINANKITVISTIKLNKYGKLTVTAEPADAEIIIDNEAVGKGKYSSDKMIPGEHNVSVRKNGYKLYNEKIKIEADKPLNIFPKLIPVIGEVEILISPFGDIYVDGQLKVKNQFAPYLFKLPGGKHNLKVINDRSGEWIKNVEINEGTVQKFKIDFSKGKLKIISQPTLAEIFINGNTTNRTTPAEYSVKPGRYTIQVKKEGYYPSELKEIDINYDIYEGDGEKITFELKKMQ